MENELHELITEHVREVLEVGDHPVPEIRSDTVLFGKDGVLDSMALVSLVVAVEQAIEDRFGKAISLADERALSQNAGPYRTVRSLTDYALKLVETSG